MKKNFPKKKKKMKIWHTKPFFVHEYYLIAKSNGIIIREYIPKKSTKRNENSLGSAFHSSTLYISSLFCHFISSLIDNGIIFFSSINQSINPLINSDFNNLIKFLFHYLLRYLFRFFSLLNKITETEITMTLVFIWSYLLLVVIQNKWNEEMKKWFRLIKSSFQIFLCLCVMASDVTEYKKRSKWNNSRNNIGMCHHSI